MNSNPAPFQGSQADPIDVQRLTAAGRLASVEYHAELSSTQDRGHEIAAASPLAGMPALIVADAQTSGRGRGANRWWTGAGSLAFSLLFDPAGWGLARGAAPQRSLAAALAVIDAVEPWIANTPIGLHWPNDVFADGRKLAGIIIDVLPDGRNILGLGLNVNNSMAQAPAEVRARATSLIDLTGHAHDRTDLLLALVERLELRCGQIADAPERIGQEFQQRCLQIGNPLSLKAGNQTTRGTCAGIAPDGALLLDTIRGRQRFYSGVLEHDHES